MARSSKIPQRAIGDGAPSTALAAAPEKGNEALPRQRRAHKKRRDGCTSCKRRHVRCGEEKPKCFQCLERSYECIYPNKPTVF
ncbi:hypothetical protein GQ53DRAFT_466237 [Thozetella sp. PMI_491]|nr:hypothetical protein GQ53DRAFT_466237 [Thozetella sp. PMI_491]